MPIYKRTVNIRETESGDFDVTVHHGPRTIMNAVIDGDMSIEEFLHKRLALKAGDKIEVVILDDENPTARIGKPKPGAGRRKATAG